MTEFKSRRTRPSYSASDRAWAIAAMRSGQYLQTDIAKRVGCNPRQVRRWLRQADIDEGRRRGLKSHERRELFLNRRTIVQLHERIRLLEEAQDFFATGTR